MPAKKYIVRLSKEEHKALTKLVKTGKAAAYKRQRAQILLKADVNRSDGGLLDKDIAQSLDVGIRTVERVRQQLVLYPHDIVRYSVTVVLCNKAQYAGKGCSLFKYCNAVAGHHGNAVPDNIIWIEY